MYAIFFFFVAAIAFIIAGPWFTILALNTLFSLTIPVNFWTWLSMLWIQILMVGGAASRNKE